MEPTELRIGNLIQYKSPDHSICFDLVVGINYSDDFHVHMVELHGRTPININGISPIPITPEWLERLGFERNYKNENIIHWVKHSQHHLAFVMTEISSLFGIEYNAHGTEHMNQVLHIHQLQNLYHALTGQELTVKELTPAI